MKDYRKIFEKHYGINIPKGYEIHHIDLNHNNNDINNLLLLPKTLHHEYHMTFNSTECCDDVFYKKINAKIHSNLVNGDNYNLLMMKKLIDVLDKCNKWFDYKLYLDGELPNIHNIEVI